jgi:hypothetical protein
MSPRIVFLPVWGKAEGSPGFSSKQGKPPQNAAAHCFGARWGILKIFSRLRPATQIEDVENCIKVLLEKLNNGKNPRDESQDNENNYQPFSDRPCDLPDKSEQHQDNRDDDEKNSKGKKPACHAWKVVSGIYINSYHTRIERDD